MSDHTTKRAPRYVAFYGSLMMTHKIQKKLAKANELVLDRHCELQGTLYDLGDYPGMVPGKGTVYGELYKVANRAVFTALDKYEECDWKNPDGSLFVRTIVTLKKPRVKCWVYFYNQEVEGKTRIRSGNWNKHLEKTRQQKGTGK